MYKKQCANKQKKKTSNNATSKEEKVVRRKYRGNYYRVRNLASFAAFFPQHNFFSNLS